MQYFLQLCLQSVQAATRNIESEVIVVDNNSSDNSCQMVKELFPDVILIQNNENYGFSKGNNIGVKKAKGEFICILNPDTVVPEDSFTNLLNFVDGKDKLGIVGCKLIDGSGKFLPESKRNVPTAVVSLQKMIGNSKTYYANHLKEDEAGEVDILAGAFMFLKKDLYEEIKGFDEDYFMYGEDIDFSFQALKLGYKNYYYPNITVLHFKGESTLKDKLYAKRFYSAMQIFYKKHFKKNVLLDAVIWMGIKLISALHINPKENRRQVKNYVLISDSINTALKSVLNKDVDLFSNNYKLEDKQEIIFDGKKLSFKEIINRMSVLSRQYQLTFKILPKKSKFIVGSNSSKSKGEVITF